MNTPFYALRPALAALTAAVSLTGLPVIGVAPVQAAALERAHSQVSVPVHQGVAITFNGDADAIFIADAGIASYQVINNRKIIVFGKNPGQTSLFAIDDKGRTIYRTTLNVRHDLAPIRQALRRTYPDFKLTLIPVHNGVAVRGDVPTAADAAGVIAFVNGLFTAPPAAGGGMAAAMGGGAAGGSGAGDGGEESGAATGEGPLGERIGTVINQLNVLTPNQVTVKVRIAEVNRNLTDKLGVKWGLKYEGSQITATAAQSAAFLAPPQTLANAVDAVSNFNANVQLDAYAREDLVSILAEPNLTVVSGETATFIAGGKIPFPKYDGEKYSIELEEYGVLLSVTPTILSGNRISMRVRPEVSEVSYSIGIASPSGQIQPGFTVRRADSTIELASGQSFAIAGLVKSDLVEKVGKVPGLGDLPVLGALTRSKEFERGETELVIVATAYISTPSGEAYVMPNEHTYIPSTWARFFLNAGAITSPEAVKPRPLDFIF